MNQTIIAGIFSIIGIIVGAILNNLLTRRKNLAEINKINAETEKTRAEALKILKETDGTDELPIEQDRAFAAIFERITKTLEEISNQTDNQNTEHLYIPPELNERVIYLYSVKHDIHKKIQEIVLSHGGGWAGHSMAEFSTFFSLARDHNLINEHVANEIIDFNSYSITLINQKEISNTEFLRIQLLADQINSHLEYWLKQSKLKENNVTK